MIFTIKKNHVYLYENNYSTPAQWIIVREWINWLNDNKTVKSTFPLSLCSWLQLHHQHSLRSASCSRSHRGYQLISLSLPSSISLADACRLLLTSATVLTGHYHSTSLALHPCNSGVLSAANVSARASGARHGPAILRTHRYTSWQAQQSLTRPKTKDTVWEKGVQLLIPHLFRHIYSFLLPKKKNYHF